MPSAGRGLGFFSDDLNGLRTAPGTEPVTDEAAVEPLLDNVVWLVTTDDTLPFMGYGLPLASVTDIDVPETENLC